MSDSSVNSSQQKVLKHFLRNADANRFIFITVSLPKSVPLTNEKLSLIAKFSRDLKRILNKYEAFETVENGQKKSNLIIDKALFEHRYLISSDIDENYFTISHLKHQFSKLQQRMSMLLSPQEQQLIAQDPLNIWLNYLKKLQKNQLESKNGVWINTNNEAVLFVKTKAEGFNLKQQSINQDFINQAIKQLKHKLKSSLNEHTKARTVGPQKHGADNINLQVSMTGAPIIALASKDNISFQIKVLSSIASLVLSLFIYIIFRSLRLLILISLPLAFAILIGMTVVNSIFGYVHGITLAFGITIIGVAVDYPLHYFSHLFADSDTNSPIPVENKLGKHQAVILSIWPKIKLGLLTTIIGFTAIVISSFSGLNQLGVFAISGLISAALFTRYVLPLIYYTKLESSSFRYEQIGFHIMSFFQKVRHLKNLRSVSLVLFVLIISFIMTSEKPWEDDLTSLNSISYEEKNRDTTLRNSLNLPEINHLFIVKGRDKQTLLENTESLSLFLDQLVKKKTLMFYESVSNYLPSAKKQLIYQQNIPTGNIIEQRLATVLSDTPFNIDAFQQFILSLKQNKTALPIKLSDLNNSLISGKIKSLIYQENNVWHGLILLSGVDSDKLNHQFNQVKSNFEQVDLINIKTQTFNLMKTYRLEALKWFWIGLALMLLFLFWQLKDSKKLVELVLPFVGSLILTIASLLFMGFSLSIFHLVTLLLVLGLGIDYSVFMKNTMDSEHSNHFKNTKINAINAFSVLVCAGSSFIMFLALALSSIAVLKAIGLTAVLGTLYALILTLIIHQPSDDLCNN